MIFNKRTNRFVIVFLLALVIIPTLVLAFGRTGVSPLDRGIEIISTVFNIQILKNNPVVQEGFMKLMIFITLFSITHKALQKISAPKVGETGGEPLFNSKTAGIVAFAFSMIGVFMMPAQWLKATGGVITALMSSIIFMAIFWGGGYVAMTNSAFTSSKDGTDEKVPGWIKNFLGVLLLLLLMFVLDAWAIAAQVPLTSQDIVLKVYSALISWTYLLLTILLIAKIIGAVGGFKGASSAAGAAGTAGSAASAAAASSAGGSSGPNLIVSQVSGFNGENAGSEVKLWWDANPSGENVNFYRIERLRRGRSMIRGPFAWKPITVQSRHFDRASPYLDRNGIVAGNSYTYRIRAEGDGKGEWITKIIGRPPAPGDPDFTTQLSEIETALNQADTHRRNMILAFINLCRANHNHINNPRRFPAPTLDMLDLVMQHYNDSEQQLNHAEQVANRIFADPASARMTPPQQAIFHALGLRHLNLSTQLRNEFAARTRRFAIGSP